MRFDLLEKGREILNRYKNNLKTRLTTSPITQLQWKLLWRAKLKVLRSLSWRTSDMEKNMVHALDKVPLLLIRRSVHPLEPSQWLTTPPL